MQAVNLLDSRYEELVEAFGDFYLHHPDAEAFIVEWRMTLARCMASKFAYGTIYDEDIEATLRRLNRWVGESRDGSRRMASD